MSANPGAPAEGIPVTTVHEARGIIDSISRDYATTWKLTLNYFLPHFELPDNLDAYAPSEVRLGWAIFSVNAVHEIENWCISHPKSSIIEPTVSRLRSSLDGILFWCLRILGVPTTGDSPIQPPDSLFGEDSWKFYLYVSYVMKLLPNFPRLYEDAARKGAMHDLVIALWTTLYDGSIPLYRGMNRHADSAADQEESTMAVFSKIVSANPRGMCDAIMSGRVCSPETFVTRTVERLRLLCDVHQLPHLSNIASPTLEITNVTKTIAALETLMTHDHELKALLLAGDFPRVCIEVVHTQAHRLRLFGAKTMGPAVPLGHANEQVVMKKSAQLSSPAASALRMAGSSPSSTLSQMKGVLEAGAVELALGMFGTILFWPSGLRGDVDSVWESIERYSLYLEILPIVCKAIRARPLRAQPVKPLIPVGRPDLIDMTKRLVAFESFAKHRVRICDNLNHADRVSDAATVTPKECSRCHSVTYCSRECQKADWECHRTECPYMARVFADRKALKQQYSHHNRAFHSTLVRYAFETYAQKQDMKSNAVPQAFGRDSVVYIDVLRPDNTELYDLEPYVAKTSPLVPSFLRPRFDKYISEFRTSNGTYDGRDKALVRKQNSRLVEARFRYGEEDINLLLLLRKTGSTVLKGTPLERRRQMEPFEKRGPTAKSKFLVRGALVYVSSRREFPNHRVPEPDIVKGWNYDTVDLGASIQEAVQERSQANRMRRMN
ncbi:hypothetical protein NMY22_g17451 [Coprinellus aureogranulatus]|nr:hypothetical protein NMY22_g17451 [Coprinellus aureogranulatus]